MPSFRAKARAVDLLGKGQISDLPTAISELWKNGYDAYAEKLNADLYLPGYEGVTQPFFIISDNGKGMSRDDILTKWIVLGTDSKSRTEQKDVKGEETLWKEPRTKMGEKGIGRLSVAYLGSPMLMLTKKIGHPLQALYFDWRILENYNLFLEDINIPIKSINDKAAFRDVFGELKSDFLDNFHYEVPDNDEQKDPWHEQRDLKDQIIEETKNIQLTDFFEEDFVAPLLGTSNEIHGTKFIIFKPDEQILALKDFNKKEDYKDDETINYIRTGLSGLSIDSYTGKKYGFYTKFKIYGEGVQNLTNKDDFFTPDDFKNCDHVIEGEFDEMGHFSGNITIYQKTISHSFKAVRPPEKSPYGPIKIKLGYLVGLPKESQLNEEQYRVLKEKLESFGGLYIYRDNFRVLPYGRLNYDFLEFEKRRSDNAGLWFFSHRRMFGYIAISRKTNRKLIDKAGREGFINNKAYKFFKNDLIAFFKDLARNYFGTKAKFDYKETQKANLKAQALAKEKEKELEKKLRKQFQKDLKDLPSELDDLKQNYLSRLRKLEEKLSLEAVNYTDIENSLSAIQGYKTQYTKLELIKPKRFKLTDNQKKKLLAYEEQYEEFQLFIDENEALIEKVRDKLEERELIQEFHNSYSQYHNSLKEIYEDYIEKLKQTSERLYDDFRNERNAELSDFHESYEKLTPQKPDKKLVKNNIKSLENIFKETQKKVAERFQPFLQHFENLSLEIDMDELVGVFKSEHAEMQKKWEVTQELAQLGMAVEIIDHEFNALYRRLSYAINALAPHVKDGSKAEKNYKEIRDTFTHLESNYKFLQPLYRTTGKIKKKVTGKEIKDYLDSFFNEKIQETEVDFESTDAFLNMSIDTYESVLIPVLINVINNALFWVTPVENRQILLDYQDDKILIMNSGVPIEKIYIKDDIFKLFFSRRPKGRGIGLYLAKNNLRGIGLDIEATDDPKYNRLNGACFIIKPYKKENE